MSVWFCCPSKRQPEEAEKCLKEWREQGYKIALFTDGVSHGGADMEIHQATYPGYAVAVNKLCKFILESDPKAEWIVAAGDDTLPDPNYSAEEIARQTSTYFADHVKGRDLGQHALASLFTFGVMQPTGDRWHEGVGGFTNAPIDRVAGSPWIGREFARRMYGGAGPYWHEYTHCFVDEELQLVAQKLGVFWQRRDLIHKHMNWARGSTDKEVVSAQRMPAFLEEANSPAHWRKFKAIFEERKLAGFPGSESCL